MKNLFIKGVFVSALLFSISNCSKDSSGSGGTPPPTGPDIKLATSTTLGQYLTSQSGQALYLFANDADGSSTCTGDCAALWPAFNVDLTTATLDNGLTASDFATITNGSGKKQVTYRGWPLHTYSPLVTGGYGGSSNQGEPAGSTGGEGIGGIWFVAKPDYTIMLANTQLKGLDGNNYKSDYTMGTANTVYFTDAWGKTIYTFALDSFNINKFTKEDLSNNNVFPMYEQTEAVVPSVLNKTLFGSIAVAGKMQMTYKGWPLYYFFKDSVRGLNLAVSVPAPGVWPVAMKNIGDPAR